MEEVIFSTSPALTPAASEALSSWQMKTRAQDLAISILNVNKREGGIHLGAKTGGEGIVADEKP